MGVTCFDFGYDFRTKNCVRRACREYYQLLFEWSRKQLPSFTLWCPFVGLFLYITCIYPVYLERVICARIMWLVKMSRWILRWFERVISLIYLWSLRCGIFPLSGMNNSNPWGSTLAKKKKSSYGLCWCLGNKDTQPVISMWLKKQSVLRKILTLFHWNTINTTKGDQ